MRIFFPLGIGRVSFTWEFISCFQEEKDRSGALPTSAVIQVLVTQNNQHAKIAYFAVECCKLLHYYSSHFTDKESETVGELSQFSGVSQFLI